MSHRIAAAAALDDELTIGDLRALVQFADKHGLPDNGQVFINSDPEYPHGAFDIEVVAHGA